MQIPKNVVQAGDVDSCHKIYIEDYVHTYLSQCRDTGSSADFCLYGKTEKEGDVRYYFIYGAAKEGPGWEMMAKVRLLLILSCNSLIDETPPKARLRSIPYAMFIP